MSKDDGGQFIALLIVGALFFFSLRGGDPPSPGPDPVNKSEAVMAREFLDTYGAGLSEVYQWAAAEIDRDPDKVAAIGEDIKERASQVRLRASESMRRRMAELIEDPEGTSKALRGFAEGMK